MNKFFQIDAYACNDLFQDVNRLPLKEGEKDVKHLQQSTSVLERRCWCKRVHRSNRKRQSSLAKKAWVPKIIIIGFQKVHGNGEYTWSGVDISTKKDQLKIAMVTMCKVRQFLHYKEKTL